MIDDLTTALVSAHRAQLAREAAGARLARLVTACRASRLQVGASALVTWLRRGQLGDGYVDQQVAPLTRRTCTCT
jgi:hypothetical protein